jgi:thiol:disulfide interchange protein DsbC
MKPLRPVALRGLRVMARASRPVLAALAALAFTGAQADEATIRKNLAANLPSLPAIDEVTRTPVAGLWEVRMGTEILYTDAQGLHVVAGELIDARTRTSLTKERQERLTAFDFAKLPLKDAITIVQGNGKRRMAVFVDPNCGYCKRFERDVAALKDVTIYTFLYPILGPDSATKSRDIWCAKEPVKAWRDWMLKNVSPASTEGTKCDDAALQRNTELGRKHRVQGTPAAVFEDGSRAPGAIPVSEIEKRLAAAAKG